MRAGFSSRLSTLRVAVLVLLSLGPIGFLIGGLGPVSAATSTSFSFAQAGDYGYHPDTVANWNAIGTSGSNFVFALGDLLYSNNTTEQNWCNQFKGSITNVEVLVGNHETTESNGTLANPQGGSILKFIQYCPWTPSLGTEIGSYGFQYYFDYPAVNPFARFILIEPAIWNATGVASEVSYANGTATQSWVGSTIDAARAQGIPWIIVGMHKVCISTGDEPCEIGQGIMRFLIYKKVDLVLQAHDHNYQRSKQLTCATRDFYDSSCVSNNGRRGLYAKGQGSVFLISGTGGEGPEPINATDPDNGYFAAYNTGTVGFTKYTVSQTSIQAQFVPVVGTYTDSWSITNGAKDFLISPSPSALTFASGSSATSTITVTSINRFKGTVALSASVSSPGLTASLNPASVTLASLGTAASTLTVSSSTPGTYTVTVTATSGSFTHTTTVSVTVTPPPDFAISASQTAITIASGTSGTSSINLGSLYGFAGTVALSTTASPSGLTATVSPTSVTLASGASVSSTLTISSSTIGTYTVNIIGTTGSLTHSIAVSVNVVVPPDFSISSSPASLSFQAGSSSTSTITLTSLNNFIGTVNLTASVSPSGPSASLNPTSVTLSTGGSASSLLTVSSSTAGSYTVAVTGTSGSLSHSTAILVSVSPVGSNLVASDSAVGPTSMGTGGGANLIQDSAGRMIAVYIDSSGRIAVSYANSDPTLGWSTPVKSATLTSAYAHPAAVLVSLTSLRIIVEGGSATGVIIDIPVTVLRDGSNNITGFTFGTATTLDASGTARYPAAVLANNGDILLAWAFKTSTTSQVRSLRWDPVTGWTNFAGTSSTPDIVLVDNSQVEWMIPSIIERQDNNNVYLLANRLSAPPSTLAFNKAAFSGSAWTWDGQNLNYETNASSGIEDPVTFAWDASRSLVVVAYGITGTTSYGVFTLNSADVKTHLDTPSLSVTERDWGTIAVSSTGDYYIFLMNVNTDGGSGTLGYVKHPSGGSWGGYTVIDSATDNQGLSVRQTGSGSTLDLVYCEGTSSPTKVKFARLSA